MDNYFTLLNIPQAIHINLENLSSNHQKIAAKHHPDNPNNNSDDTQYQRINTAYKTLKSPSKRLVHLIELAGIPYEKRGTVSDHLMDLFMSTAQTLQDADAFLRKKSTATTHLAKALLESETQIIQERISEKIDSIENEKILTLNQATKQENLTNSARDLAFLEKWQAQLKERYASLF